MSTTTAEATTSFAWQDLWALFDGDQEHLNIAHECLDRHPGDEVAVRVVGEDGTVREATFGELSRSSSQLAHLLVDRGIPVDQPVGVMMEPSVRFYAALFGIVKAGRVAVPLYTLFGPDAVRDRLEDCGAPLVLCDPDRVEVVERAGGTALAVDDALEQILRDLPGRFEVRTRPRDRAVLQYTSGTTRQLPEAVVHDHRAVVTLARAGRFGLGLAAGDRYFCPSSPAWGHGLWHGTIAPLSQGIATGTLAGRFDVDRLVDGIVAAGTTNLAAASTVYRMLLSSGRAEELAGLHKASYTGEELDAEAQRRLHDALGVPVCGMYGTTETGVVLVNFPGFPDHQPRPEALGRPMPGCRLAVLDDDGRAVGPDVPGELAVWRRGGWFRTKDLAWTDVDGYFYYGGRADDVIISSGWTISPLEVERALRKDPRVAEVAVIGIPDPTRGRVVKAVVIPTGPIDDVEVFRADLQQAVRSNLSPHEYPRLIDVVEQLPRTPNGKVDRRALRMG